MDQLPDHILIKPEGRFTASTDLMKGGIGFDRLFLSLNGEVADLTQITDPED